MPYTAPAARHRLPAIRHLGVPLLALLAVACGDGDGDTGVGVPSLEVRTSTEGTEPDADGYTVVVDGGTPRPIGITDTIVVDPLAAGAHSVSLAGIAENCVVEGDNPVSATVADGATAVVEFAVACGATTGSLEVTVATTGGALDPDGYELSVDGGTAQPIGVNASITFSDLALGSHSVTLGGLADNCQVEGANPAEAEVLAEGTAALAFAVVCAEPPPADPGKIAFTTNAVGLLGILVVNPDGTGLTNLTPEGAAEQDPVWSPDARRLLFIGDGDLQVMNADGTGREPLTEGRNIVEYRWSPDGSRIAFTQVELEGNDIITVVWVMNATGTDPQELAREASGPTWSPDSRSIAYVSSADQIHVRIIEADASGDRRLTDESVDAFQPAWSPTADEIAFRTLAGSEIMLIPADGGIPLDLTDGQGVDDGPVWSPDGQRIAFNTSPPNAPLESEIAVMNRDGTGRTLLTNRPGFDFNPDWSPDGSRIVFVQSEEGDTDSEVFVMNADGTDPINLSNRPESFETAPDWSGSGPGIVASRASRAFAKRMEEVR